MEKFDFEKEVLQHEVKTKITVTRLNEPNLDKMAVAFVNLLRK